MNILIINRWVGYNQGGAETAVKDTIENFMKDNFLKSVQNELNLSREVLSMDAVAFTYYWLRNKNSN